MKDLLEVVSGMFDGLFALLIFPAVIIGFFSGLAWIIETIIGIF